MVGPSSLVIPSFICVKLIWLRRRTSFSGEQALWPTTGIVLYFTTTIFYFTTIFNSADWVTWRPLNSASSKARVANTLFDAGHMCIERELNGLSRSCIDILFRRLQGLHIGRHQALPLAYEANIISDRRGNISSIASSIGYGAPQEFLVPPPSFLLTAKQLNGNFFNGVGPCGCFGTSLRRMESAAGPPAFFYFFVAGVVGN